MREQFFENNPAERGKGENEMNKEKDLIEEALKHCNIFLDRSSKAGGQRRDKVATRANLEFNVWEEPSWPEELKQKFSERWKLDKKGVFRRSSQEERSAAQNTEKVKEKFRESVRVVLEPEKERIPTKPSRAAHERGLEEKKRISEKKRMREKIRPHQVE